MKFSLIIGTLNRSQELQSCLISLKNQTYDNFEVIIIDQSINNLTESMINNFSWNKIIYKHVSFTGLSKARNEALKIATGDYFCLMDDDAYYATDYLTILVQNIAIGKAIFSGYIWDTIKSMPFANYNNKRDKKPLSIRQIIRTCPSAGLAIPMELYQNHGGFDEIFGVGSMFGAAEETDLLLRGYKAGYKIIYLQDLKLKHPYPIPIPRNEDKESMQKRGSYYEGFGALYKKHLFLNFELSLIPCFLEIIVKLVLKRVLFFTKKSNIAKFEIKGFYSGFKRYKKHINKME